MSITYRLLGKKIVRGLLQFLLITWLMLGFFALKTWYSYAATPNYEQGFQDQLQSLFDLLFFFGSFTGFVGLVWVSIKFNASVGSPEKRKEAWKSLGYVMLGIFIVASAVGITKLIQGSLPQAVIPDGAPLDPSKDAAAKMFDSSDSLTSALNQVISDCPDTNFFINTLARLVWGFVVDFRVFTQQGSSIAQLIGQTFPGISFYNTNKAFISTPDGNTGQTGLVTNQLYLGVFHDNQWNILGYFYHLTQGFGWLLLIATIVTIGIELNAQPFMGIDKRYHLYQNIGSILSGGLVLSMGPFFLQQLLNFTGTFSLYLLHIAGADGSGILSVFTDPEKGINPLVYAIMTLVFEWVMISLWFLYMVIRPLMLAAVFVGLPMYAASVFMPQSFIKLATFGTTPMAALTNFDVRRFFQGKLMQMLKFVAFLPILNAIMLVAFRVVQEAGLK